MVAEYNLVRAIIDRDNGIPYSGVLERQSITPNVFYRGIDKIGVLITGLGRGYERRTLEEIAADPQRKKELFNMGEEFIIEQCRRVSAGTLTKLYDGTFKHPDNLKHLIYHRLIKRRPNMASHRDKVIASIKRMPSNLGDYLKEVVGSSALSYMAGAAQSPLRVLKIFDEVYQEKTKDASLFDLSAKKHIHEWCYIIKAPRNFWSDYENVKTAVYHTLTETHPKLGSNDRGVVLKEIRALPENLQEYFSSIGLWGVMICPFIKGSPSRVIEIFDQGYQDKTGDASLFDLTQEHMHLWDFASDFWHSYENRKIAVSHILIEEHPRLANGTRSEVLSIIKSFPRNLTQYFLSLGLWGTMVYDNGNPKTSSPQRLLRTFDGCFRDKSDEAGLFDRRYRNSLEFKGCRLVR